ncbi:hypothetical protein BDC45DRAFT_534085 [Circinella umbellata]|nr:hypothetical protein BDC45DRAFT_534085 [Circinella umbellata]
MHYIEMLLALYNRKFNVKVCHRVNGPKLWFFRAPHDSVKKKHNSYVKKTFLDELYFVISCCCVAMRCARTVLIPALASKNKTLHFFFCFGSSLDFPDFHFSFQSEKKRKRKDSYIKVHKKSMRNQGPLQCRTSAIHCNSLKYKSELKHESTDHSN